MTMVGPIRVTAFDRYAVVRTYRQTQTKKTLEVVVGLNLSRTVLAIDYR